MTAISTVPGNASTRGVSETQVTGSSLLPTSVGRSLLKRMGEREKESWGGPFFFRTAPQMLAGEMTRACSFKSRAEARAWFRAELEKLVAKAPLGVGFAQADPRAAGVWSRQSRSDQVLRGT